MLAPSTPVGQAVPAVAKILPLLGSDQDGEVLAAVHAIRRTLAGHGVDLLDLARALKAPAPVDPTPPRSSPRAHTTAASSGSTSLQRKLWEMRRADIGVLSAWESGFIVSLLSILEDGKALSAKQRARAEEIYAQRIGGAE